MNTMPLFRNLIAFGLSIILLGSCAIPENEVLNGYVEAEWIYVAAPNSGWLKKLWVTQGDAVAVDQILFALDHEFQDLQVEQTQQWVNQAQAKINDLSTGARRDEIAQLKALRAEAEAHYQLAKAEQKRWADLVTQGTASPSQGDRADNQLQAAKARLDNTDQAIKVAEQGARQQAREAAKAEHAATVVKEQQALWQRAQRDIKAQRSGRVEQLFHHEGEWVNAGVPVLALLPADGLKVKFFIPQARLSQIKTGDQIRVSWNGARAPLVAKVTFISQRPEYTPPIIYSEQSRDNLVFLIEAKFVNERATDTASANALSLNPGQPVDVWISQK